MTDEMFILRSIEPGDYATRAQFHCALEQAVRTYERGGQRPSTVYLFDNMTIKPPITWLSRVLARDRAIITEAGYVL